MASFSLSLFFATKDLISVDVLVMVILPILVWICGGGLAGFFYGWCKDGNKKIEKNVILFAFIFVNVVGLFFTLKFLLEILM